MNIFRSLLVALGAFVLISTPPAQAAKPVDFSDFEGNYSGNYFITIASDTGAGSVKVNVRSSANGRKLTVEINGVIFASGSPIPIFGNLRLDQKKVSSNNFLLGLVGQPISTKTARFSGRNKAFKFKLNTASGAILFGSPVSGSMRYTLRFGARNISIVGNGTVDQGSGPQVTFIRVNGNKKGK